MTERNAEAVCGKQATEEGTGLCQTSVFFSQLRCSCSQHLEKQARYKPRHHYRPKRLSFRWSHP